MSEVEKNDPVLDYFSGDHMSADVWKSKYKFGNENTPDQMHRRMAKEIARIEDKYAKSDFIIFGDKNFDPNSISEYGRTRVDTLDEESIYQLFKDFKYIVPQGSIMSMLGTGKFGSLSNCFVIGQPYDSYGGIFQKDQEMAQLEKRRGGVGLDISTLRPKGVVTNNAANTSTGASSFMHRYSNTTREVAQDGRRGALMLTMDIRHPDIFDFVNIKKDRTKVTGANISVMLRNDFMEAVKNDEDYMLRFPCDSFYYNGEEDQMLGSLGTKDNLEYNCLYEVDKDIYIKRIKAKELYDQIVENAWDNAEPGQMFIDRHWDYSPDGVYPQYRGVTTNPCFHSDTLIETVEGRKRIADITEPTYVYSMDKNEKLCIKKASAAFKTKLDTEVLEIKLRCGSSLKVTPDHKVYVHNKGWVEAHMLEVGDRIVHLLRARRGAAYVGIKLTTEGNRDYRMEHRLVYESVFGETDKDIHHIDTNTFNNSINNLEALSHSEHAKLTALEQNPQNHQIKDDLGRFISSSDSKKGAKNIINLPEELATGFKSKWDNAVMSIEWADKVDVYDVQVEDTHCLIANGMVAHNCGEIFMQPYDACRLLAVNLFSFVIDPFNKNAYVDLEKLYKVCYEQQRIADNIVDLELEHIDRIIKKIKEDPEPLEVKQVELDLWIKIQHVAKSGRRTGCGVTGLADMIAALGFRYDSEDAKEVIDVVFKIKMEAELDCTIDLAILRGTFDGWDKELEKVD